MVRLVVEVVRVDGLDGVVGVDGVIELDDVVGVDGVVGLVWVLRTKTSQQ